MGAITVIGNLKGGSGKSTVAFNIGVWLALAGETVAAYDLDPQQTLTDVISVRNEEGYQPTFPVYHHDAQLPQKLTSHAGHVLVDVGAANLQGMKVALSLAQRVVVPVPPSQADVWSTQRFLKIVDDACAGGKRPEVQFFVNRADTHRAVRESDETAEALATMSGGKLLKKRLAQRTTFRRSFSEGLAVFELDPRSKAAEEFQAFAATLFPLKAGG